MKTTTALLATLVMGLTMTTSAQADTRNIESILKECGLGGMLFKDASPALAVLSNVTWDLGTTATLSDLSGACPGDKQAKVALFISNSYNKLETEVAMGKGEYVDTLAALSGKSVQDIRAEFSNVLTTNDSQSTKADKLFNIVVK